MCSLALSPHIQLHWMAGRLHFIIRGLLTGTLQRPTGARMVILQLCISRGVHRLWLPVLVCMPVYTAVVGEAVLGGYVVQVRLVLLVQHPATCNSVDVILQNSAFPLCDTSGYQGMGASGDALIR